MTEPLVVDVYVDYLCPYAHAGAVWLREVRSRLDGGLVINWKFFPLEQVNSDRGPDWKVWEQPLEHRTRGWDGFRGAVAALTQGDDAFERFHFSWFQALHDTPVGVKRPTVFEVAANAGLDVERFERDFSNRQLWRRVGDDYEHARAVHGVFGTPTIVFPNGGSAYFQTRPAPPSEEAMDMWQDFVEIVADRAYFKEIKRPTKPDPDK